MNKIQTNKDYSVFASFYDEITENYWYKYECLLDKILEKEMLVKSLAFDFGCGTGNGIKYLKSLKYKSIKGIDISSEMIAMSKNKFSNVEFIIGDMCKNHGWRNGDLAICSFDAINYLTREDDWFSFFNNVSISLRDGGLFIFDSLTEFDHIEIWPDSFDIIENEKYTLIRKGEYSNKLALMNYLWFVKDNNNSYKKFFEIHKQKTFSIKKIVKWLEQNELSVLEIIDADKGKPIESKTQRVIFKCKKINPK